MKRATTTTVPTTTPEPAPVAPAAATEHLRNQTLAQALFATWAGDPAVVIDSPPGAGKTRLITHLAHQLHTRAGMTVAIAAQTRAQTIDVISRTADLGAPAVLLTGDNDKVRPTGLHPNVTVKVARKLHPGHGIVAATTARWLWTPRTTTHHFDVLLIDEAYQLTFADLNALGSMADQFVLVGDPGQIDPVVTGATRRWATWASGPHLPAPQALAAAHGDDLTRLRLPQTWRLGPETTELIAPLYPGMQFTSARPPRSIHQNGATLPEYRAFPVPVTAGPADPTVSLAAAQRVRDLLTTGTVVTPDTTRPLEPGDLAVIAPHVEQAALIAAALADLPDVFVGTINQAQGLEREAVVAVHPLLGHDPDEDFALDLGRLCVALSRHRSHLSVITDDQSAARLARALGERSTDALNVQATLLGILLAA
jgi:hypothetical protein